MILHYDPKDKYGHAQLGKKLQELPTWKNGYIVEVKRNYPVRSNDQNRFYWAVLMIISTHTGIDKESLHEHYKMEYLSEVINGRRYSKSTKDLDSKEMTLYLDRVVRDAREFHGCTVMEARDFDYKAELDIKDHYDRVFESYA